LGKSFEASSDTKHCVRIKEKLLKVMMVLAQQALPLRGAYGRELRTQKIIETGLMRGYEFFILQNHIANRQSKEYFSSLRSKRLHALTIDYAEIRIGDVIPRITSIVAFSALGTKIVKSAHDYGINVIHSYYPLWIDSPGYILDTIFTPNYIVECLLNGGLFDSFANFQQNLFLEKAFRKAKHIIVVGTNSKRDLVVRYGIFESKISVIPPGYDKNELEEILTRMDREPRNQLRTISFSGRLVKMKGVLELMKIFEELDSKRPGLRLEIIGGGELQNKLNKYTLSHNLKEKIMITGYLDHRQALFEIAKSDIFVFPSHIESFPIALIEAMALAKPVVAYRVGAIPFDIIPNEKYGRTVKVGDVNGMVHGISKYLDDPELARETGKNAAEYVSKYTWERVTDSTLRIYEQAHMPN
jgi:glycosyltransferase involved in cell wall biosynthesis